MTGTKLGDPQTVDPKRFDPIYFTWEAFQVLVKKALEPFDVARHGGSSCDEQGEYVVVQHTTGGTWRASWHLSRSGLHFDRFRAEHEDLAMALALSLEQVQVAVKRQEAGDAPLPKEVQEWVDRGPPKRDTYDCQRYASTSWDRINNRWRAYLSVEEGHGFKIETFGPDRNATILTALEVMKRAGIE